MKPLSRKHSLQECCSSTGSCQTASQIENSTTRPENMQGYCQMMTSQLGRIARVDSRLCCRTVGLACVLEAVCRRNSRRTGVRARLGHSRPSTRSTIVVLKLYPGKLVKVPADARPAGVEAISVL